MLKRTAQGVLLGVLFLAAGGFGTAEAGGGPSKSLPSTITVNPNPVAFGAMYSFTATGLVPGRPTVFHLGNNEGDWATWGEMVADANGTCGPWMTVANTPEIPYIRVYQRTGKNNRWTLVGETLIVYLN